MVETYQVRGHHLKTLFSVSEVAEKYFGIKSEHTSERHVDLLGQSGYVDGYSENEQDQVARDFIHTVYEEIRKITENPGNLVKIISSPDFICKICPLKEKSHDVANKCPNYKEGQSQDLGSELDDIYTKWLGLQIGEIYTINQIAERVRASPRWLAELHSFHKPSQKIRD